MQRDALDAIKTLDATRQSIFINTTISFNNVT